MCGRRDGRGWPVRGASLTYAIRPARAEEVPLLAAIEQQAGERFRGVGLGFVADMAYSDPLSPALAERLVREGTLWVAAHQPGGAVVGFLAAFPMDGCAYVAEVGVLADHAGHRLAARLIDAAEAWARAHGITRLTLATFRDVPWNGPYYERLGFREWPKAKWGPRHHRNWVRQAASGIDMAARVVMSRPIPPESAGVRLVHRLWDALQAGDWSTARACLADDFVALWPASGELIRSADGFIGMNRARPGDWSVTVEEAVALPDGRVLAGLCLMGPDGPSRRAAGLYEVLGDRLTGATEMWAEVSAPPPERRIWADPA